MSDRLYRLLSFVLPAAARREFGEDVVQLFRDQRKAVSGHPLRLAGLWIAAAADLAKHGVGERVSGLRLPSPRAHAGRRLRATFSDVRHGLRLIRRYPASSALAIATLALGIGANTAIFSVVDAVLIRAFPYEDPDRLAMVWEKRPAEGVMTNVVSLADYLDWRRMNTVFESMAAIIPTSVSVTADGEPEQMQAAAVGWGFFEVLKIQPELGRFFQPADEVFGQHLVVILSHGLWQRRYGGDPGIVGRTLTLNGSTGWQVIGVLPADFRFVERFDLWAPLSLERPGGPPPTRVLHQLDVYARLEPGVSFAQALEAMDRLGRQLAETHPDENEGHGAHVTSMRDHHVAPITTSLVVLFAAVGVVLLIACVNVASLLLARALARRREMAVRSALGASRGRLVVQSLVESVTLSVAGGLAGIGLAALLIQALPAVLPDRLSVVGLGELSLDVRVMAFAVAAALGTGLLFGLLPARHASRPELAGVLADSGRSVTGARTRSRMALVTGEVALATLTLVGAGLVLRSFSTIVSQPVGFDSAGKLAVVVSMPRGRYPEPAQRRNALVEIEQRIGAVAGVRSVGGIDLLPLVEGGSRTGIAIEDREPVPDEPPTRVHPRVVTPGYFAAMGIPIVRGRAFTAADDDRAEPGVIVSEDAVRRYWQGADPIGARVRFGGDDYAQTRVVVGVAGDVRHDGFRRDVLPILYWPHAQAGSNALTFVAATPLPPASLGPAIREAVAAFDPDLPLSSVRTLDDIASQSLRTERAQMTLMSAFAALALLLAVVGIYGVTSQLAAARVREIGIRMTLGARPVDVLRKLLFENLAHTLTGVAIGLAAGVWLMRLGRALLYQVEPWDPITLAGVCAVLIASALIACAIPARRAVRVDPVQALRQ
jgi:putative ABC transport system permease protein